METTTNRNIEPTVRVSVRCDRCRQRLFDKVSAATGIVEVKCPRCNYLNHLDLSFRMRSMLRYRRINTITS